MKRILLTLISFISVASFAQRNGMVMVLEAPLLKSPSTNSPVLQVKRRGKIIYVNPSSIRDEETKFYKTLTRDGQDAYIEKRFVKIFFHTVRELEQPLLSMKKDPTDYRLSEPLLEGYPISSNKTLLSSFALHYGTTEKTNYQYPNLVEKESFSSAIGASFNFLKRANYDKTNRFYYGIQTSFLNQKSEFILPGNQYSSESQANIGLGPMVSYAFYRNETYDLRLQGGFQYNWIRRLVSQEAGETAEERLFSGYNISSNMELLIQRKGVFKSDRLRFSGGIRANANLPYTLSSATPIEISELWNEQQDTISQSLSITATIFFGITGNY